MFYVSYLGVKAVKSKVLILILFTLLLQQKNIAE